MYFTAKCGGIKLNSDTFKQIDDIITLTTEDTVENPVTVCGQKFSGDIFGVGKVNGRYVLTTATRDEEIPFGEFVRTNCGILTDGYFFSIGADGVLGITDRQLLEVLVSPADVDYTITVGLTSGGDPVEPFTGLTNVYPLDSIDEEYTVTVTAEGYEEFTQQVTADSDQIVQATLTPTGP